MIFTNFASKPSMLFVGYNWKCSSTCSETGVIQAVHELILCKNPAPAGWPWRLILILEQHNMEIYEKRNHNYPLVNCYILTMENHHFEWENSL